MNAKEPTAWESYEEVARYPMGDNVLVLASDDHRDAGSVYHSGADRAERHSGESAPAMAADHHELGGLGTSSSRWRAGRSNTTRR